MSGSMTHEHVGSVAVACQRADIFSVVFHGGFCGSPGNCSLIFVDGICGIACHTQQRLSEGDCHAVPFILFNIPFNLVIFLAVHQCGRLNNQIGNACLLRLVHGFSDCVDLLLIPCKDVIDDYLRREGSSHAVVGVGLCQSFFDSADGGNTAVSIAGAEAADQDFLLFVRFRVQRIVLAGISGADEVIGSARSRIFIAESVRNLRNIFLILVRQFDIRVLGDLRRLLRQNGLRCLLLSSLFRMDIDFSDQTCNQKRAVVGVNIGFCLLFCHLGLNLFCGSLQCRIFDSILRADRSSVAGRCAECLCLLINGYRSLIPCQIFL